MPILTVLLTVKPKIEQMEQVMLREDQNLALPCVANGNPKPHVTWKRVGMDQPFREGEQRVSFHLTPSKDEMSTF